MQVACNRYLLGEEPRNEVMGRNAQLRHHFRRLSEKKALLELRHKLVGLKGRLFC
jgi:hypothetical protein